MTFRQPANDGSGERLASRAETFRAGIEAAGPIVRALLSQVIDPTRLDSMQSRDPLVQTTIYVIAPLSEPLASALVWPVVSELVGALKRRHVSRVIAFFSTASFAPDDGRAIEEATAHMSRRELEALTGSTGQDDRPDLLSQLIADCGGAVWEERVGRRLFDVVHLIDREKSNQALAENALDLSVLAGNAVEAFLTADGLGHLERSLGPETVTGRPSYSVLGAASDHVPLAEYIASAIEEEQKRVVRSAVLAAGDRPVADLRVADLRVTTVEANLRALGATPDALVRRFLDAGGTPMFEPATEPPSTAWPPGARIAEEYFLPKADASDLRATKDPMRWRELLEFRAAGVAAEIKRAHGAAQSAWGLSPDKLDGGERDLPSALGGDLEPTDVAVSRANARVIPKAADLAAEQIVADMCSAPDGILRARARLSGWLGAVGVLLHDLRQDTGATDNGDDAYQTRLDAWQWAFTSAAARHPQSVTLWRRIMVVACLGALGLAGIMLLQRSFELGQEGRIALIVGLAGALALLGAAAWLATSGRMRRLKRQRIALAQEDLSRLATRLLRRGLFCAYSQLAGELSGLQAAVEDALVDLSDWTQAEPELQRAASDAGDAPTARRSPMRSCGEAFRTVYAGTAPMASTVSSVSANCGTKTATTPLNGCRMATGWPGVCASPWMSVARRTVTRLRWQGFSWIMPHWPRKTFARRTACLRITRTWCRQPSANTTRSGCCCRTTAMSRPVLQTTTAPMWSRTSTCERNLPPVSRSPTCCRRTCLKSSSVSPPMGRPRRCAVSLSNVVCHCLHRRIRLPYPLSVRSTGSPLRS